MESTLSLVGHIKVCHACKCHCLLLKPSRCKAQVALQRDGFFESVFCPSAKLRSLPPPTPQIPLENKSIFSGSLFHYLEDNKKWRERFLFIPDSYNIHCYDSKAVRLKRKRAPPPCATEVLTLNTFSLLLLSNASPTTSTINPKQPSIVPATKC